MAGGAFSLSPFLFSHVKIASRQTASHRFIPDFPVDYGVLVRLGSFPTKEAIMSATWRVVAFPLILPWRPEFWSLPLFFPELELGVLWHWPAGAPYRGRPLPPMAVSGRDLRNYAPGELKQWQAYQEYSRSQEEVDDIVRALRGEPAEPGAAEGPFMSEEALSLAWQLEMMEADQEAQLAKVDRGDKWLAEVLAPETWEEPESFAVMPEGKEVLDSETARLRYLLWRREMEAFLGPESAPLLLGRTSQPIFASLRMEAGGGPAPLVRFRVPGCRTEEEFRGAGEALGVTGWQGEFHQLLGACLAVADRGGDFDEPAQALSRWLKEELPRRWPGVPSLTWELEIWGKDPEAEEGGETLLVWGGLGKQVVPG
jgi:hypothetical protein